MPCYDSRDNDVGYALSHAQQQWHHNSPVAELLCGVMSRMDNRELAIYAPKGSKLWHWWEDHKERDRKKAAEEATRKARDEKNRLLRVAQLEKELTNLKKKG